MGKGKTKEVDEDLELEDLDEAVEESAPAKGKKSKATASVTFGASDLAALASEMMGKTYNARAIRQLLRKMAREDNPRIDREIIAGNKARYDWSGPDDPEVKTILKAIKGGEIEEEKKAALDKLKANKATKDAAKKSKKDKKAKAEAEDDDD